MLKRQDESATTSKLVIRMHIIVPLSGGNICNRDRILLILSAAHGLIIKFSALLLKLIFTYIKSISPDAIISLSGIGIN